MQGIRIRWFMAILTVLGGLAERTLAQCYPSGPYFEPIIRSVYRPNPVRRAQSYLEPVPAPEPLPDWTVDDDWPVRSEPPWNFGKRVRLPVIRQIPSGSRSNWNADCGQYVIASFLAALGYDVNADVYDEIGRAVNPEQSGVGVHTMTSYLEPYVDTIEYRSADFDDLRHEIDRGLPVILAVQPNRIGHWILVVGYTTNGQGKFQSWDIVDNGLLHGEVSHRRLKEMWDKRDNECILVEPRGEYPEVINRRLVERVEPDQIIDSPKPRPEPVLPEPLPTPTPEKLVDIKPVPPPVDLTTPIQPVEIAKVDPVPTHPAVERIYEQLRPSPETAEKGPSKSADSKSQIGSPPKTRKMPSLEDLMPRGSLVRVLFSVLAIAVPLFLILQAVYGQAREPGPSIG